MVDRATLQIAADRNANYAGCREIVARAPAQKRQLIPNLMKCRPDVIKELHFNDGLQASRCLTDGPADDVSFCQGSVVNARAAKLSLEICGDFESSALPLDLIQIFFARAICDVLA